MARRTPKQKDIVCYNHFAAAEMKKEKLGALLHSFKRFQKFKGEQEETYRNFIRMQEVAGAVSMYEERLIMYDSCKEICDEFECHNLCDICEFSPTNKNNEREIEEKFITYLLSEKVKKVQANRVGAILDQLKSEVTYYDILENSIKHKTMHTIPFLRIIAEVYYNTSQNENFEEKLSNRLDEIVPMNKESKAQLIKKATVLGCNKVTDADGRRIKVHFGVNLFPINNSKVQPRGVKSTPTTKRKGNSNKGTEATNKINRSNKPRLEQATKQTVEKHNTTTKPIIGIANTKNVSKPTTPPVKLTVHEKKDTSHTLNSMKKSNHFQGESTKVSEKPVVKPAKTPVPKELKEDSHKENLKQNKKQPALKSTQLYKDKRSNTSDDIDALKKDIIASKYTAYDIIDGLLFVLPGATKRLYGIDSFKSRSIAQFFIGNKHELITFNTSTLPFQKGIDLIALHSVSAVAFYHIFRDCEVKGTEASVLKQYSDDMSDKHDKISKRLVAYINMYKSLKSSLSVEKLNESINYSCFLKHIYRTGNINSIQDKVPRTYKSISVSLIEYDTSENNEDNKNRHLSMTIENANLKSKDVYKVITQTVGMMEHKYIMSKLNATIKSIVKNRIIFSIGSDIDRRALYDTFLVSCKDELRRIGVEQPHIIIDISE